MNNPSANSPNYSVKLDDITLSNEYTITTSAINGSILKSPLPNAYGKYLGDSIPGHTTVTLTAVPNSGYDFSNWSGAVSNTSNPIGIHLDRNMSVAANFISNASYHTLTVKNIDGQGGDAHYTILDGNSQTITAAVPSRKAFLSWQVRSGNEFVTLSNPNSVTTSVAINGGDVTLEAIFEAPSVRVFVHDHAASSKSQIQPVIRIINSSKTFPLTNFDLNFYFNIECISVPVMTSTATDPWSTVLRPEDGGYKVTFTYNGTLLPGEEKTTPLGVALFYPTFAETCTVCPSYWDKSNDRSFAGAGRTEKELLPERGEDKIVVVHHPSLAVSDTVFGHVPGSDLIFRPAEPRLGADPFHHPLDPPEGKYRQIPNVTSAWVFPLGNFLSNGSFEQGKNGWRPFNEVSCAPSPFEVETHGPTPLGASVDGFHHAKINICNAGLQGIYFDIPESEPAFTTLTGAGIVTFSAWVRSDGTPGAAAQLIYFEDSTSRSAGGNTLLNGDWQLLQFTVNMPTPFGSTGERKFRFGIAQASDFTGPLYVDGVTLVQGQAYIPPQYSSIWTNTRNSVMQKLSLIPSDPSPYGYDASKEKVVVTNTEYDSLGRLSKTYLPVADACPGGACNPFFDSAFYFSKALDSANRRYLIGNAEGLPSADSFAYAKTIYEQDPLTSVLKSSQQGRNFQIEDSLKTVDRREHALLTHYTGVSSLTTSALGSDFSKPANTLNPNFSFQHRLDPDKHESLEWKNSFGQVVKSAAVLIEGGIKRVVATENLYDERGNLIKVLPPLSCQDRNGSPTNISECVNPNAYFYDSEGRLAKEYTPDTDTIRYFFDLLGAQRIAQSAEQRVRKAFTVSVFDDEGRMRYTGEYRSPLSLSADTLQKRAEDIAWPSEADANFSLFAKYFYDEMPPAIPDDIAAYNSLFGRHVYLYPEEAAGTFKNTKGRLCAVITYQDPVEAFPPNLLSKVEEYATSAYRYDRYGRITETYRYNGFILDSLSKLQRVVTDYDVSGRVSRTEHYYSGEIHQTPRQAHSFEYNGQGKLKGIHSNTGKTLASYTYFPSTGQVKTVELDKFGDNPITVEYAYTVSGAVRSIQAARQTQTGPVPLYTEDVFYDLLPPDSLAPPRFNGTISHVGYGFGPGMPVKSRVGYKYDHLDRLLDAVYFADSAGVSTKTDRFSESIRYKDDSRIRSLRRGLQARNTAGGEYHYFNGSNRLAFVDSGMSASQRDMRGSLAKPNFAFDSSGRMVSDLSRQVQVKYDFRGRPLEFTYADSLVRRKDVMRYDENGARITKLEWVQAGGTTLAQVLVDGNTARDRDYVQLAQALNEVESRLAGMTQDPGAIVIHAVPDDDGFEDLTGIGEITAFTYPLGKKGFDIVGIEAGSVEYAALLQDRDSNMTLQKATHYTGVGNEIREEMDTATNLFTRKVMMDMPEGLGRYEANSFAGIFYLKNHLGSTMATASTEATSWQDVLDYYPYGVQEKRVASGGEKVTPTYTGKEYDDGLGLYYFGARYQDPELGVWISPDPARQHFNSYNYGSNNPINRFDPNGLEDVIFFLGNVYGDISKKHLLTMMDYKDWMNKANLTYQRKNYTTKFEFLNNETLAAALKDPQTKIIYTIGHHFYDIAGSKGWDEGKGEGESILAIGVPANNKVIMKEAGCATMDWQSDWKAIIPNYEGFNIGEVKFPEATKTLINAANRDAKAARQNPAPAAKPK